MNGRLLLATLIALSPEQAGAGTIEPGLALRMRNLGPGETIGIVITLADAPDPMELRRDAGSARGMIGRLRASLSARLAGLRSRMGPGRLDEAREFWINHSIALRADRRLIERLSADPDISGIGEDAAVFLTDPAAVSASPGATAPPWNLRITGVDSVWAQYGLDGAGVVMGMLDTGIDPSHPALAGKLRVGDAWKDIIFGIPAPYDNLGHGTFGAGILAGGTGVSGPAPAVGIAPSAKLVVCKMLDAGASTISQVVSAMQWVLDPDGDPATDDYPRIINNSWFSGTRGSTYAYAAAAAWRAAGIIPVFCAGNSGPASGSTRSPGDYRICMSVGGTDSTDDRYNATSVGPSPPDTNYFPADGRKPDLSAPGEIVYSSQLGGGYGSSSGTSWSAPHVSGAIALMLQANPMLDYDRVISMLRESSRDLGAAGYDHVYGYGRLDALEAVRRALGARIRIGAASALRTTERGDNITLGVAIEVPPMDTVTLFFGSSDTTEGTVHPASLVFTPVDWELPRTITVTGLDDKLFDDDMTFSVTIRAASDDALYAAIRPDSLSMTNLDDEDAIKVGVNSGWNLVSLPGESVDSLRSVIFPGSLSPAYSYEAGYVPRETLRAGEGYWMKFGGVDIIPVLADTVVTGTVALRAGWNLIGSISLPVPVPEISTVPPGLVASRFFEHDAGYRLADSIVPGKGYWVKASGEGILILSASAGTRRSAADE